MSKIRQTLQLLHSCNLSQRQIGAALGISKSTVSELAMCGQVWLCRPAPLHGEPLPPLALKEALAAFQPDGG